MNNEINSRDLRREEDAWFKGFEVAQEAEKLSITRVDNLVKSKDFSELIKLVEYEIVDNKLSDEGKAIIGKAIDRANFYIQIKQPK